MPPIKPGRLSADAEAVLVNAYWCRGMCHSQLGDTKKAIADLRTAFSKSRNARHSVDAHRQFLGGSVMLAKELIRAGKLREAADVLLEAGEFRLQSCGSAVSLGEMMHRLVAGGQIASLGAWTLAKLGQPKKALEFLETQRGLLLKEALLRDESALAVRVGAEKAREISGLRAQIHSLRHVISAGDLAAAANPLRDQLLGLTVAFQAAVASAGLDLAGDRLTVAHFAGLAPANGAIAAPAFCEFGAVVLVLGLDGVVRPLNLPTLTREQVARRAATLLAAEHAYAEVMSKNDLPPAARAEAADAFENVLASEAEGYWDDLIGPLWSFLASNGYKPDAPVTLVISDALDLLPLQAASRIEGGAARHAIEDRVIRFAPSFAALSQMKDRSSAGAAAAGTLGVFAPQKKGRYPTDLPGTLLKELPKLAELLAGMTFKQRHEATLAWFVETLCELSAPTDVHLSQHARFDISNPLASGLLFVDEAGDPVWLTVEMLLQLPLIAALRHVCIASCQSGRSDPSALSGEAIGLVGALIQAGAASVLSAYYSISDATAAELIPAIYAHRLAGADPAEALRTEACARLQLFREAHAPPREFSPGGVKSEPYPETEGDQADEDISHAPLIRLLDWAAFKPTCA